MPSFRYRTPLVVGAWRASRREALADAVRCRLAHWTDAQEDVTWLFDGAIEERAAGPDPLGPSSP